jgi:hypothetical protein
MRSVASKVSSAERWSEADVPKPSAKLALDQMIGAAETTQPSFDLPSEHRRKITTRVLAGKMEAAISSATVDRPTPPFPIEAVVRPERGASGAKVSQPLTEAIAAPATPAEAGKQTPNLLLAALRDLFGARAAARQSVDFAAVGSTGWAVQLGAPRSEAEAKRDLKRLNTKYRSALKGSTVGLREVLVNGETVYRLRADGLSRENAATICSRVKSDGGSCSILR